MALELELSKHIQYNVGAALSLIARVDKSSAAGFTHPTRALVFLGELRQIVFVF